MPTSIRHKFRACMTSKFHLKSALMLIFNTSRSTLYLSSTFTCDYPIEKLVSRYTLYSGYTDAKLSYICPSGRRRRNCMREFWWWDNVDGRHSTLRRRRRRAQCTHYVMVVVITSHNIRSVHRQTQRPCGSAKLLILQRYNLRSQPISWTVNTTTSFSFLVPFTHKQKKTPVNLRWRTTVSY